jgi:hypothetical protein
MPTLVLRENIPPVARASGKPARQGIGVALMVAAIVFRWLELPPPYF